MRDTSSRHTTGAFVIQELPIFGFPVETVTTTSDSIRIIARPDAPHALCPIRATVSEASPLRPGNARGGPLDRRAGAAAGYTTGRLPSRPRVRGGLGSFTATVSPAACSAVWPRLAPVQPQPPSGVRPTSWWLTVGSTWRSPSRSPGRSASLRAARECSSWVAEPPAFTALLEHRDLHGFVHCLQMDLSAVVRPG
jgi:hypothetical protein